MPETILSSQEATPLPSEVIIPGDEIPERYLERLNYMYDGREGPILRAMGVKPIRGGLVVPLDSVADRMARFHHESRFDSELVEETTVEGDKYLTMISEGKFPVSVADSHHILHDRIFHGVGFVTLRHGTANLVKAAASEALHEDEHTKTGIIHAIDGLSSVLTLGSQYPRVDIEKDIRRHLRVLSGQVLKGQGHIDHRRFPDALIAAEDVIADPDLRARITFDDVGGRGRNLRNYVG